jgi:hypothetical protein
MADKRKEFTITEVQQQANGKFTELATKFTWSRETQTSPRNVWEYKIKLRTVREDYPGVNVPTEQVLGWNFEPFDLEGIWDDRYAGEGFAEKTRVSMEQLIQRGNPVRVEFESVSFLC